MKCPYCIKVCTKCKRILVAYNGNFNKAKKGKWGLESQCRQCKKQYREEHKENILEKNKQYREEHKENILEKKKQYREEHKEEISEKGKVYYKEHKEEKIEYQHKHYEEHKENILEKKKQYYEENKEIILKRNKIYRENNPHIRFNSDNKRRNKLENQGRGITGEQWYEMMCWFDWCCAYSGEYLGGDNADKKRTTDHIIPISKGGLNEPWNCIPCFASYNYQKHTKEMEEWYIQQPYFSEERLLKIYAWYEYALNKWGS